MPEKIKELEEEYATNAINLSEFEEKINKELLEEDLIEERKIHPVLHASFKVEQG